MFDWLTSMFSSSAAPTMASQAGTLAGNAAGQSLLSGLNAPLTSQFVTPGIEAGASNVANTALNNGVTSFMDMAPNALNAGSGGVLGDLMKFMENPQFKTITGLGKDIYGIMSQEKTNKKVGNIMDANLSMAQDQFARDKKADEKRQALVF